MKGTGRKVGSQPVNNFVVCKAENELVDNAINAHCPADEFQGSVFGVVEYKMVSIKRC
jgi:hypothetical protein